MKKRYLSFLTCLALSGCSVYQDSTPQGLLNEVTQLSKTNAKIYTTMNKELYSYYLPKDVGRIKSGSLSSLFMKNGTKFVMNFNPNHIVIHDYYERNLAKEYHEPEIVEENNQHLIIDGSYRAYYQGIHPFHLQIEKTKSKEVVLFFDMGFVNFSAVTYPAEIQGLIHSMFIMAQSFDFDKSAIITEYSLKSSSEAAVDLDDFNEELPDSGQLSDLIEKKDEE